MARKKPPRSQSVAVGLSCGHSVLFSLPIPERGEKVLCRYCGSEARVTDTKTVYSLRCRDCPLSRGFGTDLDRPRAMASTHVLANAAHVVDIYDGRVKVETIAWDESQGKLPFPSYDERVAMNHDHQAGLRALSDRYHTEDLTEQDIPPY